MKSSAASSATGTSPNSGAPRRRSVALTGRSRPLDPRVDAVRRDIADIRLADRVFAPHYAEAVARKVARTADLRETPGGDGTVVAGLRAGEPFELLDITGGIAWGIATAHGLVGYVEADALGAGLAA